MSEKSEIRRVFESERFKYRFSTVSQVSRVQISKRDASRSQNSETESIPEHNGRCGEGPQRAVSAFALRLLVELSKLDGRVVGHVGATLSAPQRPRVRRLHALHRRRLSGSRKSEWTFSVAQADGKGRAER